MKLGNSWWGDHLQLFWIILHGGSEHHTAKYESNSLVLQNFFNKWSLYAIGTWLTGAQITRTLNCPQCSQGLKILKTTPISNLKIHKEKNIWENLWNDYFERNWIAMLLFTTHKSPDMPTNFRSLGLGESSSAILFVSNPKSLILN